MKNEFKPTELREQDADSAILLCGTCGLPASSQCKCVLDSDDGAAPNLSGADLQNAKSYTVHDARSILGERFEVISLLGQGGMGTVFKVRDQAINAILAVKILNPRLMQDTESVKRFQREAKAAMSLSDPHLAAVYEYGVGAGTPYLVMDFLEGVTLDHLIKNDTKLEPNRAIDLFIQICEGLAQAHQKGVIHRDVKPSNVIITRPGTSTEFAKIFDFGIAKVLPDQALDFTQDTTKTGELFGSPLYMAPEQCQGISADQRTDIHAMGCLMYKTLAGVHPFEGRNFLETVVKIVTTNAKSMKEVNPTAEISTSLDQVVLKCLEKDPSKRYQSMDSLRGDLENVRDGKQISAQKSQSSTDHLLKKGLHKNSKQEKPAQQSFDRWLYLCAITIILCCVGVMVVSTNYVTNYVTKATAPVTPPVPADPYADAERLDSLSYTYFSQGDYERAIPLLEFGVKTYKKNGTKRTGGGLGREDNYLAENLSHLGKCYYKLKNYPKAIANYREALKMFKQWGNYSGGGMTECVYDYAATLRAAGRGTEAETMLAEYQQNNNLKNIP